MTKYEILTVTIHSAQLTVITLGFLLAYRQLRRMREDSQNNIQLESRRHAMLLINHYSDEGFITRRLNLRKEEEIQNDPQQVAYLLNFFEELAIAIKHKTANEALLKDYFATNLRQWMKELYITNTLNHYQTIDAAIFENILWLNRRWIEEQESKHRMDAIHELH